MIYKAKDSSFVDSVESNEEERVFLVRLLNGKNYTYEVASQETYDGLKEALDADSDNFSFGRWFSDLKRHTTAIS